jgi:uncharacterized membrane protein (DUF485 family)
MRRSNRDSWAPPLARVFLVMQFLGLGLLALSTNVVSPAALTATIALGFGLILASIGIAIGYSWRAGASADTLPSDES